MRALVCKEFGPVDNLVVEDVDDPEPGDDEIVFDVYAAGVNFADLLAVAGQYQVRAPLPFIAGNEAAGIVTAVGADVSRFRPGDRIIGGLRGGAFAEKAIVAENMAMPLPENLSFEQGAAYSVAYGTSYHGLKQGAALRAGETVLVLGAAGGVGYAAVELARAMGATVIAAASSPQKLGFAAEAGADHCIDYSTESLKDAVKSLTDGRGVDVVYDPVGGDLAEPSLRALRWHGRYLVVGFASGDIPKLPLNLLLLKEAQLVGVWYGAWAERHNDELHENAAELDAMVAAGTISPRFSDAFTLEQFADAFRVLSERRVLGKVVFRMR